MPKNKNQLNPNRIFRMSAKVIMEVFEQGALVFQLSDRHLIEINPVAAKILKETDGQRSENQVATAIARKYKIPESEATYDTKLFYQQLATKGIVEVVPNHR